MVGGQPFPAGGLGAGEQFAGLPGVLAVDGKELGGRARWRKLAGLDGSRGGLSDSGPTGSAPPPVLRASRPVLAALGSTHRHQFISG